MGFSIISLLQILSRHEVELFLKSEESQLWWDARHLIHYEDQQNPLLKQLLSGHFVKGIDVTQAIQQSVVMLPDCLLNEFPVSVFSDNKMPLLIELIDTVLPDEDQRAQLLKNIELLLGVLVKKYPKHSGSDPVITLLTWLNLAAIKADGSSPTTPWISNVLMKHTTLPQRICIRQEPKITKQLMVIKEQCKGVVAELKLNTQSYIGKLEKDIVQQVNDLLGNTWSLEQCLSAYDSDDKEGYYAKRIWQDEVLALAFKKYKMAKTVDAVLNDPETTAISKINEVMHLRDANKDLLNQNRDSWSLSIMKAMLFFVTTATTLGLGSATAYEKLYETQGQKLLYFEGRLFPKAKKSVDAKPSTAIELPDVSVSTPMIALTPSPIGEPL